jgi:hypothetical protein
MKIKCVILAAVLTLTGCGNSNSVDVALGEGINLSVDGTLVREYSKPGELGALKVNNIALDYSTKDAEKMITKELNKLGYRRKIVEQSEAVYKVHYYKKNWPVIGALYTAQADAKAPGSRVSIYWKVNES